MSSGVKCRDDRTMFPPMNGVHPDKPPEHRSAIQESIGRLARQRYHSIFGFIDE